MVKYLSTFLLSVCEQQRLFRYLCSCTGTSELLLLAFAICMKILFNVRIWASLLENKTLLYDNNKGADQPGHPHSLTSAFVIRSMEINMAPLKSGKIQIF